MEKGIVITNYNNISDDAKEVAISQMCDRAEYINMALTATKIFVRGSIKEIGFPEDEFLFTVGLSSIGDNGKWKGNIAFSVYVEPNDSSVAQRILYVLQNQSCYPISRKIINAVNFLSVSYCNFGIVTVLSPEGFLVDGGDGLNDWAQNEFFELFSTLGANAETFYNTYFCKEMVDAFLKARNPECLSDGRLVVG